MNFENLLIQRHNIFRKHSMNRVFFQTSKKNILRFQMIFVVVKVVVGGKCVM